MITNSVLCFVFVLFYMAASVLASPLPTYPIELASDVKTDLLERRMFGKQSCCMAKGKKKAASSWKEKFECINLEPFGSKYFISSLDDVFDDVKNFGDDIAYHSMRDKLNMVLENLMIVEAQLGDPETMKKLNQAERTELLCSASSAYAKCKTHFKAFQENEWNWYLRKTHENHITIRDRYLKIFQSHFDLVGLTLAYCLQKYQVPTPGWNPVPSPVMCAY